MVFFVISSDRSWEGNFELQQILIVLFADEKMSNNAFTTWVPCTILAFSDFQICNYLIEYLQIYKVPDQSNK
jgi:hypothetical protein